MSNNIKTIFAILLGSFIYVLGINLFLEPLDLFTIGVMGFAQVINVVVNKFITNIDVTSYVYFLVNMPVIIFGFFKVGKKFIARSFLAILFSAIFQGIIPNDIVLIDDAFLSVVASAILSGIGIGILLNVGSSTGGTDIIALYFSIIREKSFGLYNLAVNGVIVLMIALLTQDLKTSLLFIILLYILGVVIDKVHNSSVKSIAIIVTNNEREVSAKIINDLGKGVTILESKGGKQD